MSLGISARLRHSKKHDLAKSHSQSQILADKLQQEGIIGTVENVMQAVDRVVTLLISKSNDPKVTYKDSIANLCQHMKVYGPYLELLYREDLNRAFVVFRNSSQDDDKLDYLSRLHLLELIELRAKNWKASDNMSQYYKAKISRHAQTECFETNSEMTDSITSVVPPILAAGEVLKSSGKFLKPTRIPGKNYCKDEVVIRNADSGKVSSGSKERLVQITGANEESINHAKQLIEDTIRRNASPVREHGPVTTGLLTGSSSSINSSASEDSALPHSASASRTLIHSLSTNDAPISEFKYSVVIGDHIVKITGDDLEMVKTSKLVLDAFFNKESTEILGTHFLDESIVNQPTELLLSPVDSLPSPSISSDDGPQVALRRPHSNLNMEVDDCQPSDVLKYSNEYMARLAMSPLCLMSPDDWDRISSEFPNLIRKQVETFDCKDYLSYRFDARNAAIACSSEVESDDA